MLLHVDEWWLHPLLQWILSNRYFVCGWLSLSHFSTFIIVIVAVLVCACVRQVCADVLPNFMEKNRQSFLMYKLLTRTPIRFSYSLGAFVFCLFHFMFCFFSFCFVCILYTLYSWGFTLYSTIAITATPVRTHRHSFYCERFKFIRVYCLEILTSTLVHAVLLTATAGVTTVDAKYFSVGVCVRVSARVTMDWKINMWRNSILQVQNHRR